ncbi:hypothetical protein PMPD1_3095 [Paramixta manurensis]|uniref:Uncharacterized protein n=1 Tax=Paramixta manurensis TaxID=2740817 RepID=A0A6M8UBC1_9GAMM|nr:hypothetical protein PMPD1_3095 [Erwiniaceae bacterium PD-1]
MTTKATETKQETTLNDAAKAVANPNATALKDAAVQLCTSAHIAIDDIEERLKKLEAYLKGLFEKE